MAAYEKYFALRNRYRKPDDMVALGIVDSLPEKTDGVLKKGVTPPKTEHKVISEAAASVAWAGLQSFTGAYNLSGRVSEGSRTGSSSHIRAFVAGRHHRHTLR